MRSTLTRALLIALLGLAPWPLAAADTPATPEPTTDTPPPRQPDLRNGEDINLTCAACHGQWGQGTKGGVYPRLAGQHQSYLEEQLRSFKKRVRINIPMYPYTQERELPEAELQDIAAFLAAQRITVEFKPAEGDLANGEKVYTEVCRRCHGKGARGRAAAGDPALSGQYPDYLLRQLIAYRNKERPGKSMQEEVAALTDAQFADVVAYISRQERHPGLAEEQAADTAKNIQNLLNAVGGKP